MTEGIPSQVFVANESTAQNLRRALTYLVENESVAAINERFTPLFEAFEQGVVGPDEFASAVAGALRDLANTSRGVRLKTALGEDRLERLRNSNTISDPDIQGRLNEALGGIPGGNPDTNPDTDTDTDRTSAPGEDPIQEELQQRFSNLSARSTEQSGAELENTEAVREHVTKLLEPVSAAYALSQDLTALENRVNAVVSDDSEATGAEHRLVPDSIRVNEQGNISFESTNSETRAKVSHEVLIDAVNFSLNNFFRQGHEKLNALDRKLAELRPPRTGEPSLTTQAVGHLTTAGGLALSGAILAQSIRQLEEGNTSPQAAVGTALGSYFTLHASYGGLKTALGPAIARRFGSQASKFTAAAERQLVRGLTRTGVIAEETAVNGLKFAGRSLGKAIGASLPFIGIAVGIYALTEDTIALTEGILEGDDLKIAQGVIDATADIASLALDTIGSVFPPAEIVTAPVSIIVNAIRFILDDAFGFIGQELDALPDDASDGEKAVAVLKGLGEGFSDVGKNTNIVEVIAGAIIDSVELDKEHDKRQAQLEVLRNPDNAFSEEELNGEPAINFNGGEASDNSGKVTFRLAEDGRSGELTLGEVTSANLEGGDGTLATDSITKTEKFSHEIHTIVLGTGESHTVNTHTEKAYLFWFIPVHSQTLISSYEADPDSLVGTYYGNGQDNTFIGLTSDDVGNTANAKVLLSNYEYHLNGEGGNDSFLLGASTNHVKGGAGADQYVIQEAAYVYQIARRGTRNGKPFGGVLVPINQLVRAGRYTEDDLFIYSTEFAVNYINNYATDDKTDVLSLQHLKAGQFLFSHSGNDLQILLPNQRTYRDLRWGTQGTDQVFAVIENFYQSADYRHLQIHTKDGYIYEYLEDDEDSSSYRLPQITGRILPYAPRIISNETTTTFIPGIQTYDVAVEVEALTGSPGFSLDNLTTLIGNDQNSRISGRGLDETIIGGDGENVLNGRGGKDTLIGGSGNDTIHGVPETTCWSPQGQLPFWVGTICTAKLTMMFWSRKFKPLSTAATDMMY